MGGGLGMGEKRDRDKKYKLVATTQYVSDGSKFTGVINLV